MRIAEPAAGLPGWGVAPRLGVMTLVPPFLRPSFHPMMRLAACLLLFWLSVLPMQTWAQTGEQAGALADAVEEIDADVLFLRHALAPGFGDPASFRIDDCRTQRNLSQAGRDQSRRIGDYLRGEGLDIRVILSSRWCRCVETAAEMGMGPFTIHDGLNSFFDGHVDRGETLALLRRHLGRIAESPDGSITLMVTHQVVITGITGIAPASGGFVAYNSRTGAAMRAGTPVKP